MPFKFVDLADLDRAEAYKLFLTVIVPRPIGWISSCSAEGLSNAAPFSWFNAVCGDPLMVMVAVGKRRGQMKHTSANIQATGEFVVNVATAACAAQMVQTSADYAEDVSEFEAVGLTAVPSRLVKPPRIGESPLHIECRLEQIVPLGSGSTDLVLGRCLCLHIAHEVLAADGRVDALQLQPMARLGRDEYTIVRELLRYPRPSA
jgi:flavin reductase (DIM6/NTAB) family NADH-FMN oxidoreductase RutF